MKYVMVYGVQSLSMTGSVIVTTPHPLAVADVLKGKEMMQSMRVPTLALVRLSMKCVSDCPFIALLLLSC